MLHKYKWKNRLLVIANSERVTTKTRAQLQQFEEYREALKDRKLKIIEVSEERYRIVKMINGEIQYSNWSTDREIVKKCTPAKGEFQVVLIGLDGRVKVRQDEIMTREQLFGTIDSMPMRMEEMRNRK